MEIKDVATHCEAKKHSYRQTQDGVVISFVLHPQEIPDAIAISPLGTRYMLAMVEIGDDEQPRAPETKQPKQPPSFLVKRAGILCTDQSFQQFLQANWSHKWVETIGTHEERAADLVRNLCNIQSRKELATNQRAASAFEELLGKFEGWKKGI